MSASDADPTAILSPVVQFTPPDIARRRIAAWNGIQTDAVEVIRREPFQAGFKAPCHLLIMCERAERDDGETLVEGLPGSTLHEFSRTLSFVPAGHCEMQLGVDQWAARIDVEIGDTCQLARLVPAETSSFTTSFRKHTGLTPTAYRRGVQ